MQKRLEAWTLAKELVNPIVEQHELKQISPGGSFLAAGPSIVTAVQQHINHTIEVAEWLMEGDKNA